MRVMRLMRDASHATHHAVPCRHHRHRPEMNRNRIRFGFTNFEFFPPMIFNIHIYIIIFLSDMISEEKKEGLEKDFLQVFDSTSEPSIFIIFDYSDIEFVEKFLYISLTQNKTEAQKSKIQYFPDDIPATSDWVALNKNAIDIADVIIFVLSPLSVQNDTRIDFFEHALSQGKRIVPVECKAVDYRKCPNNLQKMPWIFFREESKDQSNEQSVNKLLNDIKKDVIHLRIHTTLLNHAMQWRDILYEKAYLLYDKDLETAIKWEKEAALGKEPRPTELIINYIEFSRNLHGSLKRRMSLAFFCVIIAAVSIYTPSWGVFFFALVFCHAFVYLASNY